MVLPSRVDHASPRKVSMPARVTMKGLVLLAAVIFDVMSKNRKQSA